jgi:hypothetical protein
MLSVRPAPIARFFCTLFSIFCRTAITVHL